MAAAKDRRNRRRFPRVPVHGEVSGRIHTVASAPVLDLSEGGALLEVPCVLRPRSLYSFRLSLGEGKVLTLQSSVVRSYVHSVETIADGETRVQYRAAIQFLNVSEADLALLRERLYAGAQPTAEDNAPPHEEMPELLLGDILAPAADAAPGHSPFEGLTALLEESEPAAEGPAAARPAQPQRQALPPLPDLDSLPPLPDVEPWTPPVAAKPEPEPAPSAAGAGEHAEAGPKAPEAIAKPGAGAPAPPAAEIGAPKAEEEDEITRQATPRAAAAPKAEAAETSAKPQDKPAPARKAEQAGGTTRAAGGDEEDAAKAEQLSAWQRLRGWISSKPAPERGPSSLLGLDGPPVGHEKRPVPEERRGFARVVVEGSVAGEMGLVMHSDVDALSVGGLRARLPFSPEEGAWLEFSLEIGEQPISVAGSVRNVEQVRNDKGDVEYLVGLEFGNLESGVRASIREYVDRKLQEETEEYSPVD
jgi:hypothetical protein